MEMYNNEIEKNINEILNFENKIIIEDVFIINRCLYHLYL
jgi:hypothetical protein